MSAFIFEEFHKSLVKSGDTIKHNNKEMTVCSSDITQCEFFGIKIFGDSYSLGTKKVLVGRLRK